MTKLSESDQGFKMISNECTNKYHGIFYNIEIAVRVKRKEKDKLFPKSWDFL